MQPYPDNHEPYQETAGIWSIYTQVIEQVTGRDNFIIDPLSYSLPGGLKDDFISSFQVNGPASTLKVQLNHTQCQRDRTPLVYEVFLTERGDRAPFRTKHTSPKEVVRLVAAFIECNSPKL